MDRIRIVPFKVNFELVKKIDRILLWILYISVILGTVILVIGKWMKTTGDIYAANLNYIVGTLALFYFLGDVGKRFLLQLAEQRRRRDFIDNSLNTNLSDYHSEGYYSNEQIDPGVYKMGVNCFENSFFSMSIASRMIKGLVIQSLMVLVIFSVLIMETDKVTIATFLQFALPYTVLQQTIILIIYYFQVNTIFNYFKLVFGSAQEQKRDLLIIHNVINYESTIAWAGVILSDRIFNDMNGELSEKWENMKQEHHIGD